MEANTGHFGIRSSMAVNKLFPFCPFGPSFNDLCEMPM